MQTQAVFCKHESKSRMDRTTYHCPMIFTQLVFEKQLFLFDDILELKQHEFLTRITMPKR